jgi:hypothetical protein
MKELDAFLFSRSFNANRAGIDATRVLPDQGLDKVLVNKGGKLCVQAPRVDCFFSLSASSQLITSPVMPASSQSPRHSGIMILILWIMVTVSWFLFLLLIRFRDYYCMQSHTAAISPPSLSLLSAVHLAWMMVLVLLCVLLIGQERPPKAPQSLKI